MTDEEFRAFIRASKRCDGTGPQPNFWTGNGEQYVVDEGETMRDAMLDHPSAVMVYVATVGREYPHTTCSEAPLEPGLCYFNARQMAKEMKADGWRYVEGWAKHTILNDTLVRHAWCEDEDGWAVEVTWNDPSSFYFGVVFDKIPPKREGNIAITDKWARKQLAKLEAGK